MVNYCHDVCQRHQRRCELMNWITTVEPAPWSIAGYELGPLLFGHCTLMERVTSSTPNVLDLWRRLNICSRPTKGARKWLTKELGCGFSIRRWVFIKTVGRMPKFAEVLHAWDAYMEENTAIPEIMTSAAGGDTLGTPHLQGLFNLAVTELNYDPNSIDDAMFGRMLWAILAYNESQGGIRIVSDELQTIFEKLKCRNSN